MFFSCMLQSEHPQKAVLPGMKEGICVYDGDSLKEADGGDSNRKILKWKLDLQSLAFPQRLCTNLPSANRGAFSLLLQEIMISCRL